MLMGMVGPNKVSTGNAAATAYLARVAALPFSLDATHISAYTTLFTSLTSAGLFNSDGTSNYLEGLYCFRSQDATGAATMLDLTAAHLDLGIFLSSGTPAWTVDAGAAIGTTAGFYANGRTISQFLLYAKDSAHFGYYSNTDTAATIASSIAIMGFMRWDVSTFFSDIQGKASDGTPANSLRYGVNTTALVFSDALSTAIGHFVANRSASNASQMYQDGVSIGTDTTASSSDFPSSLPNAHMVIFNADSQSGGLNPCSNQLSFAHFGASLNSTQVNALTSAFAAYIAAIHP